MSDRRVVRVGILCLLLHPKLDFHPAVKRRCLVYKQVSSQYGLFHQKTICSGTLTTNLVLSETIPTFFLDSICFHLSQCPPDSNGMRCLRHLVSAGLVFTRSVVRLHHQDEL